MVSTKTLQLAMLPLLFLAVSIHYSLQMVRRLFSQLSMVINFQHIAPVCMLLAIGFYQLNRMKHLGILETKLNVGLFLSLWFLSDMTMCT